MTLKLGLLIPSCVTLIVCVLASIQGFIMLIRQLKRKIKHELMALKDISLANPNNETAISIRIQNNNHKDEDHHHQSDNDNKNTPNGLQIVSDPIQQQPINHGQCSENTMNGSLFASSTEIVSPIIPGGESSSLFPTMTKKKKNRIVGNNNHNSNNVGTLKQKIRIWKKCTRIGEGAFGKVFMCQNLQTGDFFATKQFAIGKGLHKKHILKAFEREVKSMQELSHPNIVSYFGIERGNDVLYLHMEYVTIGSVADLLKDVGFFSPNICAHYTRQLMNGLSYLHSNWIAHRDIKPANFLLAQDGTCKLGDFGCANAVSQQAGTPLYCSPELIIGKCQSSDARKSADIWALGVSLWEMSIGKVPWKIIPDVHAMKKFIANMNIPVPFNQLPHSDLDLAHLIHICVDKQWQNRQSAAELLSHPFLALDESQQASTMDSVSIAGGKRWSDLSGLSLSIRRRQSENEFLMAAQKRQALLIVDQVKKAYQRSKNQQV